MAWVKIYVGDDVLLAFTYEDASAGRSAKGALMRAGSIADDVERAVLRPDHTVRLTGGVFAIDRLGSEEIARLDLPAGPPWLAFFPPPNHPWRRDPSLAGRFLDDYPDDLKVLFRFATPGTSERMWVGTTGVDEPIGGYTGQLLNEPHTPDCGLTMGATVSYRMPAGATEPIWVSPAMRQTLHDWSSDCTACGFDMLLESIEHILGPRFTTALGAAPHKIHGVECAMCDRHILVERRERTVMFEKARGGIEPP